MKKILVPLDFGENSEMIYWFALAMAQKMQASLTLYHATHLLHTEREAIVEYERTLDHMAVASRKKLKHIIEENTPPEFSDVRVHTKVQVISPAQGISQAATDLQASLIVIGMANRNKWDDLLFGSVTRDLLKTTDRLVVVLPPVFETGPVANVLYLYHHGFSNLKNLRSVGRLVKEWGTSLHCIFVADQSGKLKEMVEEEEALQSIGATEYQATFSDISSVKDFEASISGYIEQNEISLLAMDNHDKSLRKLLHSGKETGIVRHFKLPVLFLPEQGAH